MTDRNILVTGASGFLGSNIIKAFARQDTGDKIIAACRNRKKIHQDFHGEVREGDLLDPAYRQSVVQGVDIICHAGTWSSMWNHDQMERENFYNPASDLLHQAIAAGAQRFILANSVVIARPQKTMLDDFSETEAKPFWPHLNYIVKLDRLMQSSAALGMEMVNMRLGHFVGAGNTLGLLPVLAPRLKSWIVPWLAGGKSRLPLIADTDLGDAFVAAAVATNLKSYESFNICGTEYPTTRDVVEFISRKTGFPKPLYSVPFPAGYAFAWLMERLHPLLPGKAPFLTRSIVHLAEQWVCDTRYAEHKLGFVAKKDWQTAIEEALTELERQNFPWPRLSQAM